MTFIIHSCCRVGTKEGGGGRGGGRGRGGGKGGGGGGKEGGKGRKGRRRRGREGKEETEGKGKYGYKRPSLLSPLLLPSSHTHYSSELTQVEYKYIIVVM